MRKLKLQVQISVDGFIAAENGSTDWLVWDWGAEWNWDDELKAHFDEILESVDCVLLSRTLAEGGFISHWEEAARTPGDSRYAYARRLSEKPKVVFSKTLNGSLWPNAVLATGDLVDEVNALKGQNGGDMIVYGGGTFVSSLIREHLIDEFQLFVNPTLLGSGMAIFGEIGAHRELALTGARAFDCGIAVLNYEPKLAATELIAARANDRAEIAQTRDAALPTA